MQDTSSRGNGPDTQSDIEAVEETPTTARPNPFPPTLVSLDLPTLPASDGTVARGPEQRGPEQRGPSDLPQFRPFPEPQRSVPGHPGLRRLLVRLLTFGRRT